MPVPPNPFDTSDVEGEFKFQVGDIVKVLPTAGGWTSIGGRDYSECKVVKAFYPTNGYGCDLQGNGGRRMPAYMIESLNCNSPGTPWECDLELIRKFEPPKDKRTRWRSIFDE